MRDKHQQCSLQYLDFPISKSIPVIIYNIIIGLFKKKWYNHKSSFKLKHKKKDTELNKHLWLLKEQNTEYRITSKILKQANS